MLRSEYSSSCQTVSNGLSTPVSANSSDDGLSHSSHAQSSNETCRCHTSLLCAGADVRRIPSRKDSRDRRNHFAQLSNTFGERLRREGKGSARCPQPNGSQTCAPTFYPQSSCRSGGKLCLPQAGGPCPKEQGARRVSGRRGWCRKNSRQDPMVSCVSFKYAFSSYHVNIRPSCERTSTNMLYWFRLGDISGCGTS